MPLDFHINLDLSLADINPDLLHAQNKSILALLNDFEDGIWRNSRFQNFIWDSVAETALSSDERKSLINKSMTALTRCAMRLRCMNNETSDKIGSGGEIAEIFMYGVMQNHFGALPIVPKIFYKQNAKDTAKGADSVHIVLTEDDFRLWFGEAKFFNSIENARLNEVLASVEASLDSEKLRKETSIIVASRDLPTLIENNEVRREIESFLNQDRTMDQIRKKITIPILIIHECPITKSSASMSDKYLSKIQNHHKSQAMKYFEKQDERLKNLSSYESLKFVFIVFPVPEKKPIVDEFLNRLKQLQST